MLDKLAVRVYDLKEELTYWLSLGLEYTGDVAYVVFALIRKTAYWLFWGIVLAVYFAWTATRRQNAWTQAGAALLAAGLVAMTVCAGLAGNSHNPAYLTPFGVILLGLAIMAIKIEERPAAQSNAE